MKNGKEGRGIQDRIGDLPISFTEVYIVLVSIIQATVFGYLIVKFDEHYNDFTPLKILIFLATFILIIVVWNQYMAGSTALRFKPQIFPDSILIFVLGFTETLVIHHIFSDLYLWCYSMAAVIFVSWLALVNGLYNAQQQPANDVIFKKLDYWYKFIQIFIFITFIFYLILGYASYEYSKSQIIQYVIAFIFLIFTLIYLVGGFKYWAIIVGMKHNRK